MKKLLLIWLFVSGIALVQAQPFQVYGLVEDGETGKPLTGASVFINNGSKGTTTDQEGKFLLAGIPYNTFELVISFVSYETVAVDITPENIGKRFRVKMQPKKNELEEIVIGAVEKDGWKKWGKTFTEHFIGNSANAQKCVLLNPETLIFRHNKKTGVLTVMARDQLKVRNNALGYEIKYQLEQFEYNPAAKTLLYLGYVYFNDLDKRRRRNIEKWQEERKAAYNGSMMHFMRSFYEDKLVQEGFSLRELVRFKRNDTSVRKIYNRIIEKDYTGIDTSRYHVILPRNPNAYNATIEIYGRKMLNADSIRFKSDSKETLMYFFNDMQVIYSREMETAEYLRTNMRFGKPGPQTSIFYFRTNRPLVVLENGLYFEPLDIFAEGYWAFEKLAELLPTDYSPD